MWEIERRFCWISARGRSADNGLRLLRRLVGATTFFVGLISGRYPLTLGLVEQRQLWCVGLDRLLGFAVEQPITQQLDLFFRVDDVGGMGFVNFLLASVLRRTQATSA